MDRAESGRPVGRSVKAGRSARVAISLLLVASGVVVPRFGRAEEISSGGWTTNATAASNVTAGSAITIRAHVTAATARQGLVDVEVHGPDGRKVAQRYWDNQAFAAGQRRTFDWTWTVPAKAPLGVYVVKVGVFNPGGVRCCTGTTRERPSALLPCPVRQPLSRGRHDGAIDDNHCPTDNHDGADRRQPLSRGQPRRCGRRPLSRDTTTTVPTPTPGRVSPSRSTVRRWSQAWQPSNWGVDANNFDMWLGNGFSMDNMAAHHGHDCSAPPASHAVDSLDDAVFQCRDHIMTSVAGHYAAAYLTPPAMIDFSSERPCCDSTCRPLAAQDVTG